MQLLTDSVRMARDLFIIKLQYVLGLWHIDDGDAGPSPVESAASDKKIVSAEFWEKEEPEKKKPAQRTTTRRKQTKA